MTATPVQSINFDDALDFLQSPSPYELYRLSTHVQNEMMSPEQLNPKTVSLVVNKTNERWRVGYPMLSPMIEGENSASQAYDRLPNR